MNSLFKRALMMSLVVTFFMPPHAFADSSAIAATSPSPLTTSDIQNLDSLTAQLSLLASFPLLTNQSAITQREQLMLDAAKNDPQQFFAHVIPDNLRAKLPADIQNHVEKKVTLSGTLSEVHVDDFSNEANDHFLYHLITPDGTSYSLYPIIPGILPTPSTKMTVTGYLLDNALVPSMEPNSIQSQIVGSTTLPIDESTGTQHILIVPIRFSNTPGPLPTPSAINQVMFNGPFSKFFTEQSYGNLTFAGRVLPWLTLSGSDISNCESVTLQTPEIQQELINQRVVMGDYRDVLFLFGSTQFGGGCAIIGRAPIQYNGNIYDIGEAWVGMGGTLTQLTSDPFPWDVELSVIAHEIGHTLGLMHANGWDCGTWTFYGTCSHIEYGNEYDAMAISRGFTLDFNAYYKEQLGWFPSGGTTVSSNGTYALNTYEATTTTGPRYLKIQNPALTALGVYDTPYYLEFRQSTGFDQLPAAYSSSVNLAGGLLNQIVYPAGYPFTRLLDARPTSATWFTDIQNAVIGLNTAVQDNGRGIGITGLGVQTGTQTASSTSSFTISLFRPTCQTFAPMVDPGNIIAPTALNAGEVSYFGFYTDNNNYEGCGIDTDTITAQSLPSGWSLITPSQNVPIQPGGGQTNLTTGVLAPATTTPGSYTFTIQITEARTHKSSLYPFTVTVNAPLKIDYISPKSGIPGATVSLYGTGFSVSNNMIFIPTPDGTGYTEFDPIASVQTIHPGTRRITFVFPSTFNLFKGGTIPAPAGIYTFNVYSLDSRTSSNDVTYTITTPNNLPPDQVSTSTPVQIDPVISTATSTAATTTPSIIPSVDSTSSTTTATSTNS